MSSTRLVAFILGAGTHIGSAVAAQLRDRGYRVALGSRNPKPALEDDAISTSRSMFRSGKASRRPLTPVHKLGPVNIVIYNAASVTTPLNDLLTIPVDAYYNSTSVSLDTFTAAQKALPSFRNEIHCQHPKAFIVTGIIL